MPIIEVLKQELETVKGFIIKYKGDYPMQNVFLSQAFGAVSFAQRLCWEARHYADEREISAIWEKYNDEYKQIMAEE